MTSRLPTDLLRLFTPRPPLKHVEPVDCPSDDKPRPNLDGISQYVSELTSGHKGEPFESKQQQKERLKKERRIQAHDNIVRGLSTWEPNLNLQATQDPYKTIIVARLNYDATEKHLRDEFEGFGGIVAIKMAKDMDGNFCGYAFIEFEHESDMREAYRNADGIRILGRRIVVDVERGRTVKGWLPRRFGGGLGGTRIGEKTQNQREPGRFDISAPVVSGRKYDDRAATINRIDRMEAAVALVDVSRAREVAEEIMSVVETGITTTTNIEADRRPIVHLGVTAPMIATAAAVGGDNTLFTSSAYSK
ncbi:hypothetical protein LPJ59_001019 [Coemansia sp. RSA 2399]|nr:hypothetical protein LPJ59_001019 [Coemansia sp. RSA 2399]